MNTMAKFLIKWIHVGTPQKYDYNLFYKTFGLKYIENIMRPRGEMKFLFKH